MSNNRSSRQRAPQTATERKHTELGDIVNNGIAQFKVSAATPRSAYCHLARLFLAGFDNNGQPLPTDVKVNQVRFTALGTAIASIIFVADNLVKGGVATYATTETEYLDGEDKDASRRSGPRMVMTLTRVAGWNYKTDEDLKKSKIYRKNVLKEDVQVDDM